MHRRSAGREAASPKNTNASPVHARRRRNISNSGATAGRKKEAIMIPAPPAANKGAGLASWISRRFANKKIRQRNSTAHGYTPLSVKYSGDRFASDFNGLNRTAAAEANMRKYPVLCFSVMSIRFIVVQESKNLSNQSNLYSMVSTGSIWSSR